MFDFSFGKLVIIFVLCLIVLGPEKLPKLAAQLGRFAGQARAMARHFRSQLEQEIAAEDLKKELHAADEAIAKIKAEATPFTSAVTEATDAVTNTIDTQISGMQAAADAAKSQLDLDALAEQQNTQHNETPDSPTTYRMTETSKDDSASGADKTTPHPAV
jgi:sec-independent protein translocase protein TatB